MLAYLSALRMVRKGWVTVCIPFELDGEPAVQVLGYEAEDFDDCHYEDPDPEIRAAFALGIVHGCRRMLNE